MPANLTFSDFHDRGRGNHIENEAAYAAKRAQNIKDNARKGNEKRWLAGDPTRAALAERLRKFGNGGFLLKMLAALDEFGALTTGQEAAVRKIFSQDDARREATRAKFRELDAGSRFIGEVKGRVELTLTVRAIAEINREDAFYRIFYLVDPQGNVVGYKGDLGFIPAAYKAKEPAEKGDTVTLSATVKSHDDKDGVQKTWIHRPRVKSLVKAEQPAQHPETEA